MTHCLGMKTDLAPASVLRAGLWSWEEKPRARSQVSGQQALAQQLCLGLAPGPASLGTELIEEKCSPQPRQPAGAGRRAQAPPAHTMLGIVRLPAARPWEWLL